MLAARLYALAIQDSTRKGNLR
uniref:Uncharacterized protein n=1 Tax=Rhizophora mucronata TaxID=61149 RepID=A0A2P2NUJ1_RHIMU